MSALISDYNARIRAFSNNTFPNFIVVCSVYWHNWIRSWELRFLSIFLFISSVLFMLLRLFSIFVSFSSLHSSVLWHVHSLDECTRSDHIAETFHFAFLRIRVFSAPLIRALVLKAVYVIYVCMYVCVCIRERERERGGFGLVFKSFLLRKLWSTCHSLKIIADPEI
jgi:hypothetical protein